MRPVPAVTHHAPEFLKAAYRPDIDLVDHVRHVMPGARYITWEDNHEWKWRVWRMTRERVPIPLGRFQTIGAAIYTARR